MEQKFIIPRNEELLPLVCRSKYIMLGRLGACDGATNIIYLLIKPFSNCKYFILVIQFIIIIEEKN